MQHKQNSKCNTNKTANATQTKQQMQHKQNSKQQTANSRQQTADSRQQEPSCTPTNTTHLTTMCL